MKKRSILLLIFPCIFLLLVMFHKPLVCFAIKSHLQKKAPILKNLSVNYDKACFDGYFLSFKNFSISQLKQQDGDLAKIENFSVDFNFKPKNFSFSPFLYAKGVTIHAYKKNHDSKLIDCDLYKTLSKVFTSLKMVIKDAELICHTDNRTLPSLYFEYFPGDKKQHLGSFQIFFEKIKPAPVAIDLYHSHKEILTKLKLNMFSVEKGLPFVDFILQKPMSWQISSGVFEGELHLGITTNNIIQYFKSDFQCTNFLARKKAKQDIVKFDALKVSAYLPLDIERKFCVTKICFPELIKELAYASDVVNGQYCFLNPSTQSYWEIKNFHGKTHFNLELSPSVNFSGDMVKDGSAYPFDLTAKGLIESEKNWWLQLDLAMGSQPKQTHTNIFLTLLEDSTMYTKIFFKELGTTKLNMFQDLLQIKFPSLEKVCLEEVKLSTDLHLMVKSKNIKMLLFDHVKISRLKGNLQDNFQTKFMCEDLEGKMHLHFPLVSEFESLYSNLYFKNFDLSQVHKDKTFHLNQASGKLQLEKSGLKESFIEGIFEGVRTKLNLEGPIEKLNLFLSCELLEKHIASSFETEVIKRSQSIKKLSGLSANILLEKNEISSCEGGLNFFFQDQSVESLEFGFEVSDYAALIKSITKKKLNGILGWFESKSLSESTYLRIVKAFHQKWDAFGCMKFKGTFDDKKLKFTASSNEEVFYDSEDVSVWVDASFDQPAIGNFVFEYDNLIWDISIPLNRAKVLDKKFELVFHKVIADLKIQGTKLFAENISGFCENIYFQGALDLDFKNPNWLSLNLYPKHADGQASDFQKFLRHFPDFKNFDLPIEGFIKTHQHNFIQTSYNQVESKQNSRFSFRLENGTFDVSEKSKFSDLNCEIAFDTSSGILEVKDLKGNVDFSSLSHKKNYQLNFQKLLLSTKNTPFWDIDVRFESKTYDVLRLVGRVNCLENSYDIDVDKQLSHFFNSKFSEFHLVLDKDFLVKNCKINSVLQLSEMGNKCSVLGGLGLFSIPDFFLEDSLLETFEGDLNFSCSYEELTNQMVVESSGERVKFGKLVFEDFQFHALKEQNRFIVNKCHSNQFKLFTLAEKEKNIWNLPVFECYLGQFHSKAKQGYFDPEKKTLKIALKKLDLPISLLENVKTLSKSASYLEGVLSFSGDLSMDFSKGLQNLAMELELSCNSEVKLDQEPFLLKSKKPFKTKLGNNKNLLIEDFSCTVEHASEKLLVNSLDTDLLKVDLQEMKFEAKKALLTVPPEMVLFLVKHKLIKSLELNNDKFMMFGVEIPWDNQIQTELSCKIEKGQIFLEGHLQDGYYWIGSKSVFLQNFHYQYENDKLTTIFGLDYLDFILDVFARVDLKEKPYALISLKEGHLSEDSSEKSLDIHCKYSEEDGFFIQTVDGSIYGLDVSFHRNPRSYVPHVMILSGQMKIDSSGLVKAFPKLFYQPFKELGMGSGYELSGDWMISKKDIMNSYFKGFLKGRDFEFLGFQFKTLLSELDINTKQIKVRDFRLSDQSGVMHVKELKIAKSEEDGSWVMAIPEIVVQDFRPSFLKKYPQEQEQMKPFIIKDLHFFNIEGSLGYKESFSGWGYMEFLNTFKRAYNLLDIPIEIIGRIGFDLGLFVPVKGKVEFKMDEGKIFLKDLKNSYSEGKRSKFFLSSYKDSYIGLDGSIFIDIKMKQYVLLKITQPFTLSIRGSLDKPSYSLR